MAVLLAALAYGGFAQAGFVDAPLIALAAGLSAAAAVAAMLLVAIQVIRKSRRTVWLVLLAVLLAVEGAMVFGLNREADTRLAAGAVLLRDYTAELYADASTLDSIAAGKGPAGIDAATMSLRVTDLQISIAETTVPRALSDEAAAVRDFASAVEAEATAMADRKPLSSVGLRPFRLSLTADQANAAFGDAQTAIDNLVQFGDRALKDHNVAGIRYVAARLVAEALWLEAVRSSENNTSPTGFLRFIDQPPSIATVPTKWPPERAAPICQNGLCLDDIWRGVVGMTLTVNALTRSCSSADGSFNSSADCASRQQDTGLVADWAASVTGLTAPTGVDPISSLHVAPLRFALNKGDTVSLIPASGPLSAVQTLTVDPGEAAGATVLRVATFKPRFDWPVCTPVVFNYATYLNQRTPGGLEELIGPCGASAGGATTNGGAPVTPTTEPALLHQFDTSCTQGGGTEATAPAGDPPAIDQMPVTEGGWLCTQPATNCLSLMTYSGSEYSGGPPGCPQSGLGPSLATSSAPPSSGQPGPTQNATAPPAQNLPPGFPQNVADGTYTIELCVWPGTDVQYGGRGYGQCRSAGSVTVAGGDTAQIPRAIDALEQCTSTGAIRCSRTWSSFDGSVFYAQDHEVDCSPGNPCGESYQLWRITKTG